jgi:hypothetical protein
MVDTKIKSSPATKSFCGLDSPSDPISQGTLIESSCSERQHRLNSIQCRLQAPTIQCDEETEREESRPFIAINKRMILGESKRIGGSEFRDVTIGFVMLVHRAYEGGVEESRIA